jgi:hypothetical protein
MSGMHMTLWRKRSIRHIWSEKNMDLDAPSPSGLEEHRWQYSYLVNWRTGMNYLDQYRTAVTWKDTIIIEIWKTCLFYFFIIYKN